MTEADEARAMAFDQAPLSSDPDERARAPDPTRIADYAMIGNCRTAALVSRLGSIDWLCMPRFDSPAFFAALVGTPENGRWSIEPLDPEARMTRAYRDGTLILETRIETDTGSATLVDFMPLSGAHDSLVRLVVGHHGTVRLRTTLVIRFDYGRSTPWVNRVDDHTLTALAGPDRLILSTPVALEGQDQHTVGEFTVSAGETVPFTLVHQSSLEAMPAIEDPDLALRTTEAEWRAFSDRCPDAGPHTALVKRSLLTLKALTYTPSGGIVAAATTSLPEWVGGSRNWDYRFCWLRDASFTLQAFLHLGYNEEALAWRDWLMRAVAGNPDEIQIMYGLEGERQLWENELPWLTGFRGSRPVRIGNGAAAQRQLDVFGEVADAIALAARNGLAPHPRSRANRGVVLDYLRRTWREPDSGLWEMRGPARHFVHSKVMTWVAFDRAASGDTGGADPEQLARWRAEADIIHEEVCREGFDPELGSFVQSYGSKALDASLLQLAMVGFLPPDDPRITGTVDAVASRLSRDGLVRRYDTGEAEDGLAGDEGVFLACSFWLADNFVLVGRHEEAKNLFERLVGLANDVGLLAEQYDPAGGEMLGNFPQAFSHVGIINTALNLCRSHGPVHERAQEVGGPEVGGPEVGGPEAGREG